MSAVEFAGIPLANVVISLVEILLNAIQRLRGPQEDLAIGYRRRGITAFAHSVGGDQLEFFRIRPEDISRSALVGHIQLAVTVYGGTP